MGKLRDAFKWASAGLQALINIVVDQFYSIEIKGFPA